MKLHSPLKYRKGQKTTISQPFGANSDRYKQWGLPGHNGIDFVNGNEINCYGIGIVAAHKGVVIRVVADDPMSTRGNGVYIRYQDGNTLYKSVYWHLSEVLVRVGDCVQRGQLIGRMGNCFDKETEILTDEGWKKFEKLNRNEKVITLNPKTLNIEYKKPTGYIKKYYDELIYPKQRRNDKLDFAFSEDHNIVVWDEGERRFKNRKTKKPRIIPFNQLPRKISSIRAGGGNWKGKEKKWFILPARKYVGDRWGTTRTNPSLKILMDDWLEFLGWWLSDGWLQVNVGRSGITQSFNNKKKREIIIRLLERLPLHFYQAREDFIACSKQLYDYLQQYGKKNNKKIPEFIFDLSPRQIKIFVNAYWLGDGWTHKGSKYYVFGEKLLADQMQELLLKIGTYGVIHERNPLKVNRKKSAFINGQEIISKKPYWILLEGKHTRYTLRKNETEKKKYNDYAYCIEVPNHIIYVRRNGKPLWLGNSGLVYPKPTTGKPYRGTHLHYGLYVYKYENGKWKSINPEYGGAVDPMPYFSDETIAKNFMEQLERPSVGRMRVLLFPLIWALNKLKVAINQKR